MWDEPDRGPGPRGLGAGSRPWTLVLALLFLPALVALASSSARAVDGAIEINAAAVDVGGITPGDSPGFPATLSIAGRYVLTASLEVPDSATTAIEIVADHVTLDLNGFRISGPALCAGDPVVCSPAGLGIGVDGPGSGLSVSRGSIVGMGDRGLSLGPAARVDGVVVSLNAGDGIATGDGSEIRESRIERNGGVGVDAGEGSLILDSIVRGNVGVGLDLETGAGYANNVLSGNLAPGILGGTELGANACPAVVGCPPGQIDCGGLCVSTIDDEDNCGSCGFACSTGEICSGGVCEVSCQAGLTNCSGLCTDTSTDETSCGACGVACGPDEFCSSGRCTCNGDVGIVGGGPVCGAGEFCCATGCASGICS